MGKGSFRSAAARAADQATLTHEHTLLLAEGESITYRTKLPYSAAIVMASAASETILDRRGRLTGSRYDVGKAGAMKLRLGIVSWDLKDESGEPVSWDPERADELIDGLPPALTGMLARLIDSGSPPALSEPVDEAGEPTDEERADTEGNDSGGS